MTTVYLYGGQAKFAGASGIEWNSPEPGSTHKFILFVAQEGDAPQPDAAEYELASLGFVECQIGAGKPISVESLNDPQMHAFQKHYEGALSEGSSLVWYP